MLGKVLQHFIVTLITIMEKLNKIVNKHFKGNGKPKRVLSKEAFFFGLDFFKEKWTSDIIAIKAFIFYIILVTL